MASRIRKLASETAIYGVSSILGRAVNFLLFPFYSNVFPPEEFGPIIIVYAAFVFLNIVYQYGMESAYLKHAADPDGTPARQRVFSTSVWTLGGTAAVLSTALYFFGPAASFVIGLDGRHVELLAYAAAILFVDTLVVVPYAELRLRNRPWYFAAVRFANVLVNVGANLLLILGAGMGIEAILIANLAASNVSLLLLLPVFWRLLRWTYDRTLVRSLLRFGLPFVPGGLGYAMTERVNVFFLERMDAGRVLELYGDAMPAETVEAIRGGNLQSAADYVVGAYGGMLKLAIFMALAVQMFRYAWQPFFLNHAKDDDAADLFGRVFLILTAGLLVVLLLVSFFALELVSFPLPGGRTLIAEAYWVALPIIPIALTGYFFQGWYYHFSAGAYIRELTAYFVPCTLAGAAVALVLNATLVPAYGMVAAAWATAASYATMALLLPVLLRGRFTVHYPRLRSVLLAALAAGLLILWHTTPALQTTWVEALLLAGFVAGAVAIMRLRAAGDS